MSFELPFQLQFHWCYVKELNARLITASNQQLAVRSKAATVCILAEMTERFQCLNCAMIKHFNL